MSNYDTPPDETVELPADRQMELAVLGSILLEPDLLDRLPHLKPEHFFYTLNARAYMRMREFWANGEPVDIALVSGRDADMRMALIDAANACTSAIYGPHYAGRVIDLAQKRHYIGVAEQLSHMAFNGKTPIEIGEFLRTEADQQETSGTGNPYNRWAIQIMTAAEMAECEQTERTYIVKDLLRDGSLSIVYGKPGEFKSMLLMDMAICIGGGRPWLAPTEGGDNSQAAIPTRQARVLWLNYDQAHEDVIERFAALHRAYGDGGENVVAISQSEPAAVLMTDEQARKLGSWIAGEGFELVVVDSLIDIRGARKLIEEEMGDLLRLWRVVAEVSGSAIVIISHPTKNTADLYGSQFIKAKLDHLYVVTRNGDAVEVSSEKQRSFGLSNKLTARWTYEHAAGTRTLYMGRFWGAAAQHSENVTTQDECLNTLMSMPGLATTPDDLASIINERRSERGLAEISPRAIRVAVARLELNHRNVVKLSDPLRYHYGAAAE